MYRFGSCAQSPPPRARRMRKAAIGNGWCARASQHSARAVHIKQPEIRLSYPGRRAQQPLRIAKENRNKRGKRSALALGTFSHPDYTVGVGFSPNSCLAAHGLTGKPRRPLRKGRRNHPAYRRSGIGLYSPHPAPKVDYSVVSAYYGRTPSRASSSGLLKEDLFYPSIHLC